MCVAAEETPIKCSYLEAKEVRYVVIPVHKCMVMESWRLDI